MWCHQDPLLWRVRVQPLRWNRVRKGFYSTSFVMQNLGSFIVIVLFLMMPHGFCCSIFSWDSDWQCSFLKLGESVQTDVSHPLHMQICRKQGQDWGHGHGQHVVFLRRDCISLYFILFNVKFKEDLGMDSICPSASYVWVHALLTCVWVLQLSSSLHLFFVVSLQKLLCARQELCGVIPTKTAPCPSSMLSFNCYLYPCGFLIQLQGLLQCQKTRRNTLPALTLWVLPTAKSFVFLQLCAYSHNSSTRLVLFASSFLGISCLSCYILIRCEVLFSCLCNNILWMFTSQALPLLPLQRDQELNWWACLVDGWRCPTFCEVLK